MSAFLTSAYTVVSASANLVIGTKQMTDKARRFLQNSNDPYDFYGSNSANSLFGSFEVRKRLFTLQARLNCLVTPLSFLLLWSMDKDSCIRQLLLNAMSTVENVDLFLNGLGFCGYGLGSGGGGATRNSKLLTPRGGSALHNNSAGGGGVPGNYGAGFADDRDHGGSGGNINLNPMDLNAPGGPQVDQMNKTAGESGTGANANSTTSEQDILDSLDFHIRELDFAQQSVTMALTMVNTPGCLAAEGGGTTVTSSKTLARVNLDCGQSRTSGATGSSNTTHHSDAPHPPLLPTSVSPSALLKATKRIQEVALVPGGGELCVCVGQLSVNGEAFFRARLKILMQNKCFQLRLDPVWNVDEEDHGTVKDINSATTSNIASTQFPISVALDFELMNYENKNHGAAPAAASNNTKSSDVASTSRTTTAHHHCGGSSGTPAAQSTQQGQPALPCLAVKWSESGMSSVIETGDFVHLEDDFMAIDAPEDDALFASTSAGAGPAGASTINKLARGIVNGGVSCNASGATSKLQPRNSLIAGGATSSTTARAGVASLNTYHFLFDLLDGNACATAQIPATSSTGSSSTTAGGFSRGSTGARGGLIGGGSTTTNTTTMTPIEFFYTARLCTVADPSVAFSAGAGKMSPALLKAFSMISAGRKSSGGNVEDVILSLPDETMRELLRTKGLTNQSELYAQKLAEQEKIKKAAAARAASSSTSAGAATGGAGAKSGSAERGPKLTRNAPNHATTAKSSILSGSSCDEGYADGIKTSDAGSSHGEDTTSKHLFRPDERPPAPSSQRVAGSADNSVSKLHEDKILVNPGGVGAGAVAGSSSLEAQITTSTSTTCAPVEQNLQPGSNNMSAAATSTSSSENESSSEVLALGGSCKNGANSTAEKHGSVLRAEAFDGVTPTSSKEQAESCQEHEEESFLDACQ